MSTRQGRPWAACLARLAAIATGPARPADAAPPSPIALEEFFGSAKLTTPVMSPDGIALALLVRNAGGRRPLGVIDTADLRNVKVVASFNNSDIDSVLWVNDKRVLVSSSSDRQPARYVPFDMSDNTLIRIGSARPKIVPRQMAMTDFFRVKARDGHDLPVYANS